MSQIKIKQVEGLQAVLDAIGAGLQSGSLKSTYTQIGHGFSAGSVIAFLNGSWVLADASSAEKLGRLVVESVTTDEFVGVQLGNIEISGWGLTPGKFYMVDETGNGTVSEYLSPSLPNFAFSNPILQSLTEEKAQVLPWRPSLGATPLAQGQEYSQTAQSEYTNGNGSSTGISLDFTPFADSTVQVYINGIAVTESYGNKDGEVYFSNDGGTTSAGISELIAGSTLHWNTTNAGYEIGNGDTLDLVYEKSSLD